MLRGGVSDKLGNEYEALWAARHLISVYLGEADSLRYEPIEVGGFEFELKLSRKSEWHQSKQSSTSARWTISGLAGNGVLHQFKKQLSADGDARCVFVTDNNAAAFGHLAKKAQQSQRFIDFEAAISQSKENRIDFDTLKREWNVDAEAAYHYLSRCRVETTSTDSIQSYLDQLFAAYFFNDPKVTRDAFFSILRSHLTHQITRPLLISELETRGIQPKDYAATPTASDEIKHATQQYLEDINSRKPMVEIDRTVTVNEVASWYEKSDLEILILTANAGAGKSYVVAKCIDRFLSEGAPVLAIRIDRNLDINHLNQLGMSTLGIDDNPLAVLALSSRTKQPILVIDQLDAVSDASGRRQSAKDVVFDLIQSNTLRARVKIILACRAWDFENDTRFKSLVGKSSTQRLAVPELTWKVDIEPALLASGYATTLLSERQTEILSNPASLAIFLRLSEPNRPFLDFSNSHQLIERLIDEADREISEKGESWSAWEVMGVIVDRMNKQRQLAVPSALVDNYKNARRLLQSTGLISLSGDTVQLSHESYFDFIFARKFVAEGQSLSVWLKGDEQQLFRRTQVRQILEYMRTQSGSWGEYLREVKSILCDDYIRYHIKDAVARWLAGCANPKVDELNIILSRSGDGEIDKLFQRILFGRAWFRLLVERGLILQWLNSTEKWRDLACRRIQVAMEHDATLATTVLREYWRQSPDNIEVVAKCMSWMRLGGNAKPAIELFLEIIPCLPQEEFTKPEPQKLQLITWNSCGADEALQILSVWYARWFELHPNDEPFVGDGMTTGQVDHHIAELMKDNPVAFLTYIGPLFVEAMRRSLLTPEGHERHLADWLFTRSFSDEKRWGGLIKAAIERGAKTNPEVVRDFASSLDNNWGRPALHYKLCAISQAPSVCHELFVELIEHPELFRADERGCGFLPAAAAAKMCKPYLSDNEWERFEHRLLDHKPEHRLVLESIRKNKKDGATITDLMKEGWLQYKYSKNGYEKWAIIETVGKDAFTDKIIRELPMLRRKFGDEFALAEESGGGAVISPLPKDIASKMSDQNWLSAISHYDSDSTREYKQDHVLGGAKELAGMLEHITKENPKRYINLLPQIPNTAHEAYACHIIDGLKSSELPIDDLIGALKNAFRFNGDEFATSLVYFVDAKPGVAKDEWVFSFLKDIALNGLAPSRSNIDDDEEIWGSLGAADIFGKREKTISSGVFANRRSAWEALSSVAWGVSSRSKEIFDLIERQISSEENLDVMPAITRAVHGLINSDRDRAFIALERIANRDIRLVTNFYTHRIFNWLLWQDLKRFNFIVEMLISSENEDQAAFGYLWKAQRAICREDRDIGFEELIDQNELAARCAAVVANDLLFDDKTHERALEWVKRFIRHSNSSVVDAGFRVNWDEALNKNDDTIELVEKFITSPAFERKSNRLIYLLSDCADRYPKMALRVANRILDLQAKKGHEQNDKWDYVYHLDQLVMGAYEGLEGHPEQQRSALDLIDRFLASESYQIDRLLANFDRL